MKILEQTLNKYEMNPKGKARMTTLARHLEATEGSFFDLCMTI